MSGCGNTAYPNKAGMRDHKAHSLVYNWNIVSATWQFKEIVIFVGTIIRITYLIIHGYVYLQDMSVVD